MARQTAAQKKAAEAAKAAEEAAKLEQAALDAEGKTEGGTNTPNLETTGIKDTQAGSEGDADADTESTSALASASLMTTEGSELEGGSDSDTEEGSEEVVQDYSAASILLIFEDDSMLAQRIANRLSSFCNIVMLNSDADAMPSAANNMADILAIANNASNGEFISIIKGLTAFINHDIETYENKAAFFQLRPFRPFLGSCPPACSFLETIMRLAPTKTRKKVIKSFDKVALDKFLKADKKELFISYFSE